MVNVFNFDSFAKFRFQHYFLQVNFFHIPASFRCRHLFHSPRLYRACARATRASISFQYNASADSDSPPVEEEARDSVDEIGECARAAAEFEDDDGPDDDVAARGCGSGSELCPGSAMTADGKNE